MSFLREFFRSLIYVPLDFLRTLFTSPGQLFSSGRRVLGISLPARVSLLTALFLVICVIVHLYRFLTNSGSTPLEVLFKEPWYVFGIVVLLVLIPVVVYYVVKFWLEGNVSPFEDIDKAWKAGLDALDRCGIDLSQVPLYLILGSSSDEQEQAIFRASRLSLTVEGVPKGPAALHWYANAEGIYVVASNTSGLSRLAELGEKAPEATLEPTQTAVASVPSSGIRGTMIVSKGDSAVEMPPPATSEAPARPAASRFSDIRGTMVSGSAMADTSDSNIQPARERRPVTLSPDDAAHQNRRLEYLSHLIRRVRRPICPWNGILTLLPFGLLHRGPREGTELQRVVKNDLTTVLRVGGVRCPVIAVVVGMEEEGGFRELVKRLGAECVGAQRFGKGFSVSNFPIPERLEALCAHACGAFEDWVYTLFREKDALNRLPEGNTRLYGMLCNIRRNIQTRLTNILASGYGSDPDQESRPEPLFFSGCYFAAVGATEDRQAFVKSIFDKLAQENGELQWTAAALEEDRRHQSLARLLIGLDCLMVLVFAGLLLHSFKR